VQAVPTQTVARLEKAGATMSREDLIKTHGTITAVHGMAFKVRLDRVGSEVLVRPSGKLGKFLNSIGRKRRAAYLLAGDTVSLELSPYDMTKGFIVYRTTLREQVAD
jgi:translation initiation factor IF-1